MSKFTKGHMEDIAGVINDVRYMTLKRSSPERDYKLEALSELEAAMAQMLSDSNFRFDATRFHETCIEGTGPEDL